MKPSQKEELRQKNLAELNSILIKKQKELVEAKFKLAQSQLKDVHLVAKIRDEIAVIETIMTEKRRQNE